MNNENAREEEPNSIGKLRKAKTVKGIIDLDKFTKEFDKILEPYKDSHNYKNLCLNLKNWKQNLCRWLLWEDKDETSTSLEDAAVEHFLNVMKFKSEKGLKVANMTSFKEGARWMEQHLKSKVDSSNLPHWKKSTLPNDKSTGFNSNYFSYNGYNIDYKELFEKLPKED
jgi:hypothetical protein